MNNTFTNKNYEKINLDWGLIQSELKLKLGTEIYESWIKKINLVEEFNNYILFNYKFYFFLIHKKSFCQRNFKKKFFTQS